jgi:membrane dipeptidase
MREIKSILFVMTLYGFGFWLTSCTPQQVIMAPEKDEEALKAEAREIHDKVLTVDTHSDTPSLMLRREWDIGERHEPGQRRSGKIDLPRMSEGGLDAEFFAVYIGQGERTPEGYARARERASLMLDAIHKMGEDYPQLVELATSPEDAYRLEKEGKRAAFIGMENGYPIGKDLSLVKEYYERGIRYITLCHSSDNDICDSSTDRRNPEDNGLSDFGKEVVAECNRLGIMVDVSHISDKSFFDVLEVTKAPVIASHSSVRTLCDHPRNLSDEMLEALAANNGVIQICFVSSFVKKTKPNPEREKALAKLREKYGSWSEVKDENLREKMENEYMDIYEKYSEEKATVEDLVDHIDYVVKLIGVDHVGIGTDFDGGGGVEGCDDVSELPNITKELLRRGYSEEDIQKIWGKNIMRVFRKVIEIAKTAVV